ncbi:MAG TPA: L,D-transpeptidase, partial [Roseiarcus sp.]|nr:L,D-transpeptidase [Roseiarcus sp.]
MRRLARLCFLALLCAVSGPALAANDGLALLGLQESPAPADATAAPTPAPVQDRYGGGLIGLLLSGGASHEAEQAVSLATESAPQADGGVEAQFRRQEVDYKGPEAPGTIVIDTPDRFLFLIEPGGRALRYGVGVGRPGFAWAGVKRVSRKAEWPDWTPPAQMLSRRPDLPRHMAGGPGNPLGARALYLGSSIYRIHGTNEPSTIGHNVSSGCIRMMNED